MTKGRTEIMHTFVGSLTNPSTSDINCDNQSKTTFELKTFDNKTPRNEGTATHSPFTMQ